MRTPHGVADIVLLAFEATTTVQDLVRLVSGQAVPAVADLDGRAIDTGLRLAEAGLSIGSVIDTTTPDRPAPAAAVGLMQLAGPGAGALRPLPPGRYRLGPGRRLRADELESAPVEITALELTVGDDGSVEARPGYAGPVLINGKRITEPAPWLGGMLSVGGRVFGFESPCPQFGRRQLGEPDQRGMVAFNRPPRSGEDGPRQLVVDAVRDAVEVRPTLWRRRAGDLTAFTVPVGLAGDPPGPITVDLSAERGIALVGGDEFTAALARTILVEATTLHGPADLDIAIAAHPDRLARWDWAKWLPHLRGDGVPRYLNDESQLHEWIAQLNQRAVSTAGELSPSHLTLLVGDDPGLWLSRPSPLVSLFSSHPVGLRLLALTDSEMNAPAVCTAVITEGDQADARLIVPDRSVDVAGIVPALTEIETAATVARHLAPLDDTERPAIVAFSSLERGPESLAALLHPLSTRVDGVIDEWRQATAPLPAWLRVPLGTSSGERLTADAGPGRNILVSGAPADLVADVATGILCGLAAQLPPDMLSVVHVATHNTPALDGVDTLPHMAGRFSEPGAAAATRLIVRLAKVVGALDPANERVVVVLDDAGRTAASSPGLADGLIELAEALPALQLVMTADSHSGALDSAQRASFAVQVTVDEAAGCRRGSLRVDSERVHLPFVPYAGPEASRAPGGLVVRPAVYGRGSTPLERRLEMLSGRAGEADDASEVSRFAAELREAATHLGRSPSAVLVPHPLPPLHRTETLFAERPGDAIPLGLVDLPEQLATAPLWWQPGAHGSLLFIGSPRSGVDAALSTIVLGAASRFSADELHIYSVDPFNRRRVAAELLPHAGSVTTPDRVDEVTALLDWLAAETGRRLAAGATSIADAPALLLLVHDLGQLRRQFAGGGDLDRRLAAVAAGAGVNVNIVATAWRADEAGSLVDAVSDSFVGALAAPTDYQLLGVVDPTAVEGQLGRCWSTATDRMVQLALPPVSLAPEIDRLGAEPAASRPPTDPVDRLGGRS